MKAFLSHSSKDKLLVKAVFEDLGAARCVYAAESFEEGKTSAEAIFSSLGETDLFVLFLSRSAIESEWVKYELRVAHNNFANGRIKGVLLFIIDDTPLSKLPAWLQQFHISKSKKSRIISRKIRSRLVEISAERRNKSEIFIGRTKQLDELKLALALPPSEGPSIIGIAGWPGIGRRTLARKLIAEVYPYLPRIHPEILVPDNTSVDDFYRGLLDVTTSRSLDDWRNELNKFSLLSDKEKTLAVANKIRELHKEKEILFIIEEGGILRDDGSYLPWIENILSELGIGIRPFMIFIQKRMMPFIKRKNYSNLTIIHLQSFEDEDIRTMLGLLFRENAIDYKSDQLSELTDYLGGHPINVHFAVQYAKQYGLDALMRDKSELVQFIVGRAKDMLKRLKIDEPILSRVLILLSDYRILDIDTIIDFLSCSDNDTVKALRNLEDYAVIEHLGKYYRVAPYLREALARHFGNYDDDKWRKEVAHKMAEFAKELKGEDEISLAVLDASIIAAFKIDPAGASLRWAIEFILPSHLLRAARDAYDNRNHALAVDFCKEALKKSNMMTIEAQIEANRLLGISQARLGHEREFWNTVKSLEQYSSIIAKRNVHFLRGFWFRRNGRLDQAESEFLQANKLHPDNFHVVRELATVLAHQGRYPEAEVYARAALKIAPTNPFIIDCFCEVIIGKSSKDDLGENKELQMYLKDLDWYGELEGHAFYDNRMASYLSKIGQSRDALEYANRAVSKSSWRFNAFMTRAKISIDCHQTYKVPEDIKELRQLESDMKTGEGKSGRFRIDEIEIRYNISTGSYETAKSLLSKYRGMPRYVRERLEQELFKMGETSNIEKPEFID